MEYKSYDQLLQEALEYKEAGNALVWAEAEVAFQAVDVMKVKPGQWAADTGYSTEHVRVLRKTFCAFPDQESRVNDPLITFSHHSIAAKTNNPQYWIEQAAQNLWSTRQLSKAITTGGEDDPLDKYKNLFEKVVKALDGGGEGAEWLRDQLRELEL